MPHPWALAPRVGRARPMHRAQQLVCDATTAFHVGGALHGLFLPRAGSHHHVPIASLGLGLAVVTLAAEVVAHRHAVFAEHPIAQLVEELRVRDGRP